MERELEGWVRSRPLRVAFIVEDGEHAQLAMDGIFSDCYNRWGGRFSLIVPCGAGRIVPAYWPWLEAYDPDVVYSYVALTDADVLELHERLGPAKYAVHRLGDRPRLDVGGFRPSYGFEPLSSLSTVFRIARYKPRRTSGSPLKIIDSWHTEIPSRFLADNFGTYGVSRGGGTYPHDVKAAASLLTIVPPEGSDRARHMPGDLDGVSSEMAAFKEFADGRATSMAYLSSQLAPKVEIRTHRWSGSFNLVVGGSFSDRLLFWNARLMIPAWLDPDITCARVEPEQLRDPAFLAILGDMLKRYNHANDGSGGQSQLSVRSASLSSVELEEVRDLLRSIGVWGVIRAETAQPDEVVPAANDLRSARDDGSVDIALSLRTGSNFRWTGTVARPSPNVPDHLIDAPSRQIFTVGFWYSDLVLEYDGPGPSFGGNRWVLPLRWRTASAFKVTYVGTERHAVPPPVRRSRGGGLAVPTSANQPIELIAIPAAAEAIHYALVSDGAWANQAAARGEIVPSSKVRWATPSNEARYLTGVLGMAGGLSRASQFLLHPFLRDKFSKLGGTPKTPIEKAAPTVERLRKRAAKNPVFDVSDDREKRALADLVLKAAQTLQSPMDFLPYDELLIQWKAYRVDYWAANPMQGESDPEIDWDAHEQDSLDECLVELRQSKLLFQGHAWTCPRCHHHNWLDFSELSSEIPCEVCKLATRAPVGIRWLFRPNQFLIESLRDHSVLSLVWVLSALASRARRSFIFTGPTKFGFRDGNNDPDAEADLLALVDGEAILCEAKSSWRGLRAVHLTDFVALARRLRPDIALLAVMEGGTGPLDLLATAREQLATDGIRLEVLTPDVFAVHDEPYLRFDEPPPTA